MVGLKIMSVAAEGGTGWRVPQFKILEGTSPRNRHFYRKNPSTYNFFRIFNIFKTKWPKVGEKKPEFGGRWV